MEQNFAQRKRRRVEWGGNAKREEEKVAKIKEQKKEGSKGHQMFTPLLILQKNFEAEVSKTSYQKLIRGKRRNRGRRHAKIRRHGSEMEDSQVHVTRHSKIRVGKLRKKKERFREVKERKEIEN